MKDRIRQLRKHLKMNQSDFGEKVGVKGNTVGNYELGLRCPSDAVIFSICREFNVNEEWIRNGAGEMFVDLSKEEYIAEFIGRILKDKEDSFKKRYIAMLSKLDEAGWEALEKVAVSMGTIKMD